MDTQLLTLSKIFTERLFRIPDYQRGYAWTEKQLKEFWSDVEQLEHGHNHYTGVLTLEAVAEDIYRNWEDDLWIIEAKTYQPYFVVDGQQRLTTAIVLIQVILERIHAGERLNFTAKADVQRRFIFDSRDEGISRSYIFGYERDNPSYEFLKTKVFCERSSRGEVEETVYTQNLARAKQFFAERVAELPHSELETLYRKITQQLLFNIFTIADDVDVCVAFETMNNRGKPLSYLELLKNRLIYLSLKFDAPDFERKKLRRAINDCWKALYHNLGRNKDQPLQDDRFLLTHYILYFGKDLVADVSVDEPVRYRRLYRADFASDLLEKRFVPKNVMPDAPPTAKIKLTDIYEYVSSLQEAVEVWYKLWNPLESDIPEEPQLWLDKLNRLEMGRFIPLVLAVLQSKAPDQVLCEFLRAIERNLFVFSLVNRTYRFMLPPTMFEVDPVLVKWAIELADGKTTATRVTRQIEESTDGLTRKREFVRAIIENFRREGFYAWSGIRYLLFEYNLDLQKRSKTDRPKIFWPEFTEHQKDYVTVEHIYPRQARHSYWTSRFNNLTERQRKALRHSLGNLLPLSRPKNASLSNKPFPDKVDGRDHGFVGYRYGSYAENEVSKAKDWTPEDILLRGLRMIEFIEERWRIPLGNEAEKRRLLGLEFIGDRERPKKSSSRESQARHHLG